MDGLRHRNKGQAMVNMRVFDHLVEQVMATPDADTSVIKLVHGIAELVDSIEFDEDDTGEADAINDELSDLAFGLRAKAQALADAILRKPRPDVIPLPGPIPSESPVDEQGA